MHPASANTSAWTGEGPSVLLPSMVMPVAPDVPLNLRSPVHVRSATTGGFIRTRDTWLCCGTFDGLVRLERRGQTFDKQPADWKNHKQIRQQVAESAVGTPRFGRLVDHRAEWQIALFGRLMHTLNQELQDKDEQEDRCGLEKEPEVEAMAESRPYPGDR